MLEMITSRMTGKVSYNFLGTPPYGTRARATTTPSAKKGMPSIPLDEQLTPQSPLDSGQLRS